jgi:hypothetical protein
MSIAECSVDPDRIFARNADPGNIASLPWSAAVAASPGQAQALLRAHGYLHLSGVFSDAELGQAARDVASLFEVGLAPEGGTRPELRNILRADRRPLPSRRGEFSYQIEHAFRQVDSLRALIESTKTRNLLSLLEIASPVLFDDQCYLKPGRNGGPTYLHRDSDFFGPLEMVTIWVPLTRTDEDSGCLWFLPASHVTQDRKFGLVRRSAPPCGDPDIDRDLDFFYEFERPLAFTPVPCAAGDVLLIHRHMLHASKRNMSAADRLSYLIEVVPEASIARYRHAYPGVFDYDDRIDHVMRLRP